MAAEKYGSNGRPLSRLHLGFPLGEPVENELRTLVLPDHDRADRLAALGVPGEHRLALMVEPACDDLPGWVLEQFGDGLDNGGQDLLAVLLDPALLGVPDHLVAPRLTYRLQALVEQGGLDAGRPLVDTQHELLAHPLTLTVDLPAVGIDSRAPISGDVRGAAGDQPRQPAPPQRAFALDDLQPRGPQEAVGAQQVAIRAGFSNAAVGRRAEEVGNDPAQGRGSADPQRVGPSSVPAARAPGAAAPPRCPATIRPVWRPPSAQESAVSAGWMRLPVANTPWTVVCIAASTSGPRVPGSSSQPAITASSWSGIQSAVKTTMSQAMRPNATGIEIRDLSLLDPSVAAPDRGHPAPGPDRGPEANACAEAKSAKRLVPRLLGDQRGRRCAAVGEGGHGREADVLGAHHDRAAADPALPLEVDELLKHPGGDYPRAAHPGHQPRRAWALPATGGQDHGGRFDAVAAAGAGQPKARGGRPSRSPSSRRAPRRPRRRRARDSARA